MARAIVKLTGKPQRETIVGPGGRFLVLQHKLLPGHVETVMAVQVETTHLSRHRKAPDSTGNLYEPSNQGRTASVTGGWHGRRRTAQRRAVTAFMLAGVVALVRKTDRRPRGNGLVRTGRGLLSC